MDDASFLRGDVVVCVLAGDYGKPRPAIVIQADLFNATHASVVVCPISSEITGLTLFRIPLPPSASTGLRKASEVMIDKMSAILSTRIAKRIGRLSRPQITHVNRALRLWLELPET
jgi:mRNA interferase MazF